MWGIRVVIPTKLRGQILDLLHCIVIMFMWGIRVVIPTKLRGQILDLLHCIVIMELLK